MDRVDKISTSVEDELWNFGWYHGSISRQDAVDQIINNGDFLVRDCISAPGTYVLTCKNPEGKILHFRMNNISQEDGSICYQFEDDCYCRVSYLIEHHIQTKKPVSALSNAVLLRPVERNSILETHYQKLKPTANGHHRSRSHSSMSASSSLSLASSPPISTGSGSGKSGNENTNIQTPYQAAKMKSGSRASLLASNSSNVGSGKNGIKNGYGTTKSLDKEASQLKRFKSLPHGKINRRIKRKAPSPPKNVEPYKPPTITTEDGCLASSKASGVTQNSEARNDDIRINDTYASQPSSLHLKSTTSPHSNTFVNDPLTSMENDVIINQKHAEQKEIPKCPEGVKLRRRAKCLQQKYNFNQRQSMYCAKLQQFSNFLKGDNRRHSFYGLTRQDNRVPSVSLENVLDSNEDIISRREKSDNSILDNFMETNLLRSPSDSSLMYLNQIAIASGARFDPSEDKKTGKDEKSRIFITENSFTEEIIPHHFMPFELPPPLPPKAIASTTVNGDDEEECKEYHYNLSRNHISNPEGNLVRDFYSPQIAMTSCSRTESQQSQYSFYASEAIYDTVPKPRSCLTKEQLEHNHIYDVPRRLMAKQSKPENDIRKKQALNTKVLNQKRCESRESLDQRYQERSSSSFEHSSKRNGSLQQRERISKSNYGSVTSINMSNKMSSCEIENYFNAENGRVTENGMSHKSFDEIDIEEEAPQLPPRQPRLCPADIGPKLPPKNRGQFNNAQQEKQSYPLNDWWDVKCSNANTQIPNEHQFLDNLSRTKNRNMSSKSASSMDNIDRNIQSNHELEQHYERCQSYTTNGLSNDYHFGENGLAKRMEYTKTPYGEASSSFTESTSTLKSTTSIDTFSSLPPPPTDFELHQHEEFSSSLYSLEREFTSLPPMHSNCHDGTMISKANSQNLSIFSSVSSVTLLQEGDGVSLDNSSLPGDPFPQGLPQISGNVSLHSSCSSSTLESPISSPLPPPRPIYLSGIESPNEEVEQEEQPNDNTASQSETKRSLSRSEESSLLIRHNSESNLSRIDVEFENVEEHGYTLLQSIDADQDQECSNDTNEENAQRFGVDEEEFPSEKENNSLEGCKEKQVWDLHDTNEEDGVVLRRHSWQYAENELLIPDAYLPSKRPKSDIGQKKLSLNLKENMITSQNSSRTKLVESEVLNGVHFFDQTSEIVKDIIIDVVHDAMDERSDKYQCIFENDYVKENERETVQTMHKDIIHDAVVPPTTTIISTVPDVEQGIMISDDMNGSFQPTDMSDIIEELIDLTIKHRNICHMEATNASEIDFSKINGSNASFVSNGSQDEAKTMNGSELEVSKCRIKSSPKFMDPINFESNLLPNSFNQSLDPRAISATQHILLSTPSSILALHLTKLDSDMLLPSTYELEGLGLLTSDEEEIEESRNTFITSLLERCVCLKTFVAITILTAMNVRESARMCSKWIQIATQLKQKLGNHFGLYNLLSGLTENHLIQWGDLWICLKENHQEEHELLECELRPLYLEMKQMKVEDKMLELLTAGITLPHIVPYMSLFPIVSHKPIFQALYQNTLENLSNTERNEDQLKKQLHFNRIDLQKICLSTKKIMSNIVFDDTLLDLFRTEYHMRLHWGGQSRFVLGYPENTDEGHEEFEKVISTLFEMCSQSRKAISV